MAGMERVELPLTEPESVVLPLDDIPMIFVLCVVVHAPSTRVVTIPGVEKRCKPDFEKAHLTSLPG